MKFNEYIRWSAEDLEELTNAQTGCMKLFEETGNFEWVGTAAYIQRRIEAKRRVTAEEMGWYLV